MKNQQTVSGKVRDVIKSYVDGKISSKSINEELKGVAFVTTVTRYFHLCNYSYKDLATGNTYNENV